MAVSHKIDKIRRVVICVATGVIDDEQAMAGHRALADNPDFDPTFAQIIDYRGVTDLETTTECARAIAADHLWAKESRRAIVAASDVTFGQSRQYEMLSEENPGEFRVFRDMDSALSWLEECRAREGERASLD